MKAFAHLRPEELLEDHFLESLKPFALLLRKRRDLQRGAGMLSMRVGQTREFRDYRAYAPKDDLRSIDWRLYARLGKLFVRLFEDQQQAEVHLYLDGSASMAVPYREKWVCAARMTLALAYLSWQSHHRVSVHGFGPHSRALVTGMNLNEGFKHLIQALCAAEPHATTDFAQAFRKRPRLQGRRAFHVVIADFLSEDRQSLSAALRSLRAWGGEVQLLQLLHPEERSGELGGPFELEEVESQRVHRMSSNGIDGSYTARFLEFQQELQQMSQRFGMGFYSGDAALKFEDLFRDFLRRATNFRKI